MKNKCATQMREHRSVIHGRLYIARTVCSIQYSKIYRGSNSIREKIATKETLQNRKERKVVNQL